MQNSYFSPFDHSAFIYTAVAKPSTTSPEGAFFAFRQLRSNPLAMAGGLIILFSFLVSVFAYVLAPDHSQNANRQIPDLSLAYPGSSFRVLRVQKNQVVPTNRFFDWLLGWEEQYQYYPYNEITYGQDSLFLDNGAGLHFVDLAFPVDHFREDDDRFHVQLLSGHSIAVEKEALLQQIKEEHQVEIHFPLGSDRFGRCMFSRLIIGIRVSLLVGCIAVLVSLSIGIFLGLVSGYYKGWVDTVVVFLINTVWSIPTILLVFAIVLAVGRQAINVYLAVGLTMWVEVARLVRGQVMEVKERTYIEAAQAMGASSFRIMWRHILPNIAGPVLVIAAANFATAILIEAGLSYLGFGVQPPTPSWGNLLNENYGYAISGKLFLALPSALAIMILVLSFNVLGNGLRDALDIRRQ